MFVREKRNRSGSTSVQVISKFHGRYKVFKTIGSATTQQKIEELILLAKQEIKNVAKQRELIVSKEDSLAESLFETLSNSSIRILGPEIIFGKIYDFIGFNQINEDMFRHLVISRMAFPLSKLKTIDYVKIEIDYEKYSNDNEWDGLKGYVTNTKLTNNEVLENYKNLWHIEKAFRMSKTDLRIRPIYHRLRNRIEAHICISFTAYCIYKELDRVLYAEKSTLSLKKAAELTHNMYQITYTLPDSKVTKNRLLRMDDEQAELCKIINKNF